jgi:YbbR-like protein
VSLFRGAAGWIKDAFTKDLGLKAISLVLGILAYALVHGGQDIQKTVSVDIEVVPPPASANRVLLTSLPSRAKALLNGPRNVLDDLSSNDLGAMTIDLRKGTDSRIVFDTTRIRVPTGVKVIQIEPAVLDLIWDDRISRDLPVHIELRGAPPPGTALMDKPMFKPDSVHLSGPKSLLQSLLVIRTEPFDLTGLGVGPHERPLVLEPPALGIELEMRTVLAKVVIAPTLAERSFQHLKVQVAGQAKAKTSPAEVDVRLRCPNHISDALRAEQIVPHIEVISKEPSGSYVTQPKVLVDGCEARFTPAEVLVRW